MEYATVRYIKDNTLIVDSCPFCKNTHRHGAGLNKQETKLVDSMNENDRIKFLATNPGTLGSRAAHCGGYGHNEYRLVFDN